MQRSTRDNMPVKVIQQRMHYSTSYNQYMKLQRVVMLVLAYFWLSDFSRGFDLIDHNNLLEELRGLKVSQVL